VFEVYLPICIGGCPLNVWGIAGGINMLTGTGRLTAGPAYALSGPFPHNMIDKH
jgi:hypothetical protein